MEPIRDVRCHKKTRHVPNSNNLAQGRSVVTQVKPSRTFEVYSRSDWSVTYCLKLGFSQGRSEVPKLESSRTWVFPRSFRSDESGADSHLDVYSRSEWCQSYAVSTEERKQDYTLQINRSCLIQFI
jgi:hypothetical protein